MILKCCRKYVVGEPPESSLSRDHWVSVLKLSTMWELQALRNAAIQHLDGLGDIDPVDKCVLAMQYDVKEWMLAALVKLAQRPEPISTEEGRRMGFETALKLSAVREKVRLCCGDTSVYQRSCGSCGLYGPVHKFGHLVAGDRDPATGGLDFTPLLQTAFGL